MIDRKQTSWAFFLVLALLLIPAGCKKEESQTPAAPKDPTQVEAMQPIRVVAELKPTAGNQVSGTVTFESVNGDVRVIAYIEGLTPGRHGFHIHEQGDCSAPDGTSAGGHFNPSGTPHGAPDNPAAQRHVGDLGNVEANRCGIAHYERMDQVISLEGPDSIVGKAVIVHARPDDLTSQPTGNAGPRVACGVIRAEGETK